MDEPRYVCRRDIHGYSVRDRDDNYRLIAKWLTPPDAELIVNALNQYGGA